MDRFPRDGCLICLLGGVRVRLWAAGWSETDHEAELAQWKGDEVAGTEAIVAELSGAEAVFVAELAGARTEAEPAE